LEKKGSFDKTISIYSILTIIFLVFNALISSYVFFKYINDIKLVNEINLLDSLKKKISILSNYIKRFKLLL